MYFVLSSKITSEIMISKMFIVFELHIFCVYVTLDT